MRYAELVRRKVVKEVGDILDDASAHSNNNQVIGLAGGMGTEEGSHVERVEGVVHSKAECRGQVEEVKKKKRRELVPHVSIKANIAEEATAALVDIDHKWRIYSDGGRDGNGAKGVWGRQDLEQRSTWYKSMAQLRRSAICVD